MNITIRIAESLAALYSVRSLPSSLFVCALWIAGQSLRAETKYWNGSGNDANGAWTTSNGWWSLDLEGTRLAESGVYGGDVAIFSTNSVGSPQVSQLGADLQAAGLQFQNRSTTTLVAGKRDRSITLFGGIAMDNGAGAATIGSTKGKTVTLNQQPDHAWTNHSASLLTIENDVTFSGTYGQHVIEGSGDIIVNGAISGNGTQWKKSGGGALVLNGDNTHTGDLTIGSGILSGSGTVAANTFIHAGAVHSAGAVGAVGSQNFERSKKDSSTLTYEKGSIFSWDIDPTQKQTRGTGYDTVAVAGTLASTTDAIFRVVIGGDSFKDSFWDTDRVWDDIFTDGRSAISNWAGIFSGTMQYHSTTGEVLSPVGRGSFSLQGNSLAWTPEVSLVPEPGTALAGVLLVSGLLRRRRPRSIS